jgi:hypothetical protein
MATSDTTEAAAQLRDLQIRQGVVSTSPRAD